MLSLRTNWSPWKELNRLNQEMNELFSTLSRRTSNAQGDYPALRVWQSEDGVAITTELPGYHPDEIDVTVNRDSVTIRGERKLEDLPEGTVRHRLERWHQSFTRTVSLPFEVNPQQTEASYRKGILTLKMTRPEEQKPQRVKIGQG